MDIYEEIRSLLGKLAETSSIVSAVAALAGVAFSLISAWFMTSRDIPRKSEESQNQLSIQIAHIKSYLEKQHFQERVNRYSSDMLNISQYVVGAALVTSFVNETLSKELVGILGVVTLLSSFAHQQLRPDIKRSLAARRIVSLNELLRDAEITAAGIAADPEEQNYKILPIAREYMVQLHAIQRDELGCLPQR